MTTTTNERIVIPPLPPIQQRYLQATCCNPYRRGTWRDAAEGWERDGLRAVALALGPPHPKPGASCGDYFDALREGSC